MNTNLRTLEDPEAIAAGERGFRGGTPAPSLESLQNMSLEKALECLFYAQVSVQEQPFLDSSVQPWCQIVQCTLSRVTKGLFLFQQTSFSLAQVVLLPRSPRLTTFQGSEAPE